MPSPVLNSLIHYFIQALSQACEVSPISLLQISKLRLTEIKRLAVSEWCHCSLILGCRLIAKPISSNSTASNQWLSCGTEDGCAQGRSIQGS